MHYSSNSFWGQVVGQARQGNPYYGWRKTARFCVNALINPDVYKRWLTYIEQDLPKVCPPNKAKLFSQRLSLRYLRNWFSHKQKLETILHHHKLLEARFSQNMIYYMREKSFTQLAELTGESGCKYSIALHMESTKEGELAICCINTELNAHLGAIRGTFGPGENGETVFWIGALQGPSPPFGRDEVNSATKDLHVLRPKQAVLHAVCAMCEWMNVTHMYAISNKSHVSHDWRSIFFKRYKIQTHYDDFWSEYTEKKTPKGDYEIELPLRRRELKDVQAKRRKAWIKRYACIDGMNASITNTFNALSASRNPKEFEARGDEATKASA